MGEPAVDRQQLMQVLTQIAAYSADGEIPEHLRAVARALETDGFIIMNGPPQQEMRDQVPVDVP